MSYTQAMHGLLMGYPWAIDGLPEGYHQNLVRFPSAALGLLLGYP